MQKAPSIRHLRHDRLEGDLAASGFPGALVTRSDDNLDVAVERGEKAIRRSTLYSRKSPLNSRDTSGCEMPVSVPAFCCVSLRSPVRR